MYRLAAELCERSKAYPQRKSFRDDFYPTNVNIVEDDAKKMINMHSNWQAFPNY